MFRNLLTAAAGLALVVTVPALAASHSGAQCRDAKGRFAQCPPAASAVTKDKNGKCHVASGPKKGQFTKCP